MLLLRRLERIDIDLAPILIVNDRHPYKSRTPDRVVVPLAQPYKADMLTEELEELDSLFFPAGSR